MGMHRVTVVACVVLISLNYAAAACSAGDCAVTGRAHAAMRGRAPPEGFAWTAGKDGAPTSSELISEDEEGQSAQIDEHLLRAAYSAGKLRKLIASRVLLQLSHPYYLRPHASSCDDGGVLLRLTCGGARARRARVHMCV